MSCVELLVCNDFLSQYLFSCLTSDKEDSEMEKLVGTCLPVLTVYKLSFLVFLETSSLNCSLVFFIMH